GYHYETLALAGGDIEKAIQLFRDSLKRLREVAPVEVAAMHGSPLSRYDNRAIWQHVNPADFGLSGEAYRDMDYRRVIYFNDTGRTWNPTRYNLRDVTDAPHPYHPESTDDLIKLLTRGDSEEIQQICISTHPERWNANPLSWTVQAARDVSFNLAKLALRRVYRT
ncbi:MAG TPA: hypothetical protein VJZ27_19630, partial [Aggregatilineales bacterium]|nr:hypothetical protein [Aggregatilineales bacterium]